MYENTGKLEGVEVKLGLELFVIPPLAFDALEKHGELIENLPPLTPGNLSKGGLLGKITAICGDAIRRNYPNLTDDELKKLIDLGNLLPLVQAVMAVNQIKRSLEPGEPTPSQ